MECYEFVNEIIVKIKFKYTAENRISIVLENQM